MPKRNIQEEPSRNSNPMRALEGFLEKISTDFPGVRDPGAEIVLQKGKQQRLIPPGPESKKAS